MSDIETDDLHQYAVLWAPAGTDHYGKTRYGDPVEISVRWEDGYKEVKDAKGSPVKIDATVVVDREIELGSRLWKGMLADVPTPVNNPMRVMVYKRIPDIDDREVRRTVMVSRESNLTA